MSVAVPRRDLAPEPARAQAERLNAWLLRAHPGWYASLRAITQTDGTGVFELQTRSGRVLVLKQHVERAPFMRELFALSLWQGMPDVPRLLVAPDHVHRCFLVEHLPEPAELSRREQLLAAAAARLVGPAFASVCARRGAVTDRAAARIMHDDLCSRGPDVAIGDRKHEHFRWRAGSMVTLDFEAIVLGGLPLGDLAELAHAIPERGHEPPVAALADAYCRGWGAITGAEHPSRRLADWLAETSGTADRIARRGSPRTGLTWCAREGTH